MREVGAVIGKNDEVLFWHEPDDRTEGSLPDSPRLWDVLWKAHNAGHLKGFAHSHTGEGLPWPSEEDISTYRAIERALGRTLQWWITSSDVTAAISTTLDNGQPCQSVGAVEDPSWVAELRQRSEYQP